MPPSRVLVAISHSLARLAAVGLVREAGMVVVGETGDGIECVRLCERHQPAALVLSQRLSGLAAPQVLRSLSPAFRPYTVCITDSAAPGTLLDALGAGVRGLVLEENSAQELVPALTAVSASEYWLRPPLCSTVFASAAALAAQLGSDPLAQLSAREREVFILAARGEGNVDIAPRLNISPRTVEAHRGRAFHKLGIGSLREAIRFAAAHGLLEG